LAYVLMDSGQDVLVWGLGLAIGYGMSTKYSAVVLIPTGLVAIALSPRGARLPVRGLSYLVSVVAGFLGGTPYALFTPGAVVAAVRRVAALGREGVAYHVGRPPAWIDYPINVLPYALSAPMLVLAAIATVWIAVARGRRLLLMWSVLLS